MKLIKKGSTGSDVKKWQGFLLDLSYNVGKADGIFGGRTDAATRAFQEKYELVVDGIVGKLTVQKAEAIGFEKQTTYKRDVNEIIWHITASNDKATVEDIRKGHLARGFSDIGYHYIVDRAGVVHPGRDEEVIGAHVNGYNVGTIGIAYIARGSDTEPNAPYGKFMTPEQKEAMEAKTIELCKKYGLKSYDVSGHNDYNPGKACPCFKVKKAKDLQEVLKANLI